MYLALKSAGVKPGDKVLCNAYTLAPVPGAIENAGGAIELVDIVDDYTIDLDDLEQKAKAPNAKMVYAFPTCAATSPIWIGSWRSATRMGLS